MSRICDTRFFATFENIIGDFLYGKNFQIAQAGGWRHGAKRSEPSRLALQEGRVFYIWFTPIL